MGDCDQQQRKKNSHGLDLLMMNELVTDDEMLWPIEQCKDAAKQAEAQIPTPVAAAEATFFSSNAEFDFFCE